MQQEDLPQYLPNRNVPYQEALQSRHAEYQKRTQAALDRGLEFNEPIPETMGEVEHPLKIYLEDEKDKDISAVINDTQSSPFKFIEPEIIKGDGDDDIDDSAPTQKRSAA